MSDPNDLFTPGEWMPPPPVNESDFFMTSNGTYSYAPATQSFREDEIMSSGLNMALNYLAEQRNENRDELALHKLRGVRSQMTPERVQHLGRNTSRSLASDDMFSHLVDIRDNTVLRQRRREMDSLTGMLEKARPDIPRDVLQTMQDSVEPRRPELRRAIKKYNKRS